MGIDYILSIVIHYRGATCYLNSLIQAMFMTPEFRHGLFKIDPEELGYSNVGAIYFF